MVDSEGPGGPSRSVPWWQRFFGPDYLRMYRLDPEQTRSEARGIEQLLGLDPGATVLDLCCGQARYATELAERGFRVTGLDRSSFLLGEAKKALTDRGVAASLVLGDMRRIPFVGSFDAVINMFTSFGFFEDEADDSAVVEGVRRALKPGGPFLIDLANRRFAYDFEKRETQEPNPGVTMECERRYSAADRTMHERRTVIGEDGRAHYEFRLRLYDRHELCSLLERAGLEPEACLGGLDGQPYQADGHRIIVLARKRRDS
jgi:SAM-dependent methyltransferase